MTKENKAELCASPCFIEEVDEKTLSGFKKQLVGDNVNHPEHYTKLGKLECIDVVENFPCLEANIIKYVWRHRYKNGAEDIKKAIWYAKRLLKKEYDIEE